MYSWIRDGINFASLELMVHECLTVRSIKMWWERFGKNSSNLLCLDLWLALQPECLICTLVCSFSSKLMWLVSGQSNDGTWVPDGLQHFILLFQFLLLFIIVAYIVTWLTLERKWVEWVLRSFLMIDIILTIVPVRERLGVCRLVHHRLDLYLCVSHILFNWRHIKSGVILSINCSCFNSMRIYNFGLFLKIKCFSLLDHKSLL